MAEAHQGGETASAGDGDSLGGVSASLELAAGIAALQADLDDGPSRDASHKQLLALLDGAPGVCEAWRPETEAALRAALSELDCDDAQPDAKRRGEALLAVARGIAACNAYDLGERLYPAFWASRMLPLAEQQLAARKLGDAAQTAQLLSSASAAISRFAADPPAPEVTYVKTATRVPAASVAEGLQPSAEAEAWGPRLDEQALTAPPAKPGARATAILKAARTQIGVKYDETTTYRPGVRIDCSGLVQYSLAQAGVTVPRRSQEQWTSHVGRKVPLSDIKPGDVVSLNNGLHEEQPGHTAIYAGDGKLIVASSGAGKVVYQPISVWSGKIIGVKRYN